MNFKSLSVVSRMFSPWRYVGLACALLASPSYAATVGSVGGVTLRTDGLCTAASRTVFSINFNNITGVDNDFPGTEVFAYYLVDGSGKILHAGATFFGVGDTIPTFLYLPSTIVTPASGPFRIVLDDVINFTVQPVGNIFVGGNILVDVAFDANALDSDCPTGAPVPSDTTDPTVTVSGVPVNSNAPFTATFTFDEDITGFDLSDITTGLDNATASNFATVAASRTFSALITPTAAGTVTVGVDAAAAKDLANNDSVAATSATSEYDADATTVTISGVPANSSAPFTATFTFNEDITGFDLSDITAGLDNATASNFATVLASRTFSALITPTAAGTVTVGVDAAAAKDLANNDSVAATNASSQYDVDAPTVEILGAPASKNDITPFQVTIQFSEDVSGFELSDITIGNGTIGDFVGVDANTYTIVVTPLGAGDVTIDVGAGVAVDGASNPNIAAAQVVVSNTIVADTHKLINNFMTGRAQQIIQSQPDLIGRLTRRNDNSTSQMPLAFAARGDLNNHTMSFATSLNQLSNSALDEVIRTTFGDIDTEVGYAPFDVWVDGSFARADNGNSNSVFASAHFGLDYLLTPDVLVGVMGQIDWTTQQDLVANTAADGLGWMVGPYVVAQLQEHLFFDALVLGGQSFNNVNPIGLYVDSFSTQRWLARAKLTGRFTMDEWTFSPFISGSFFSETQNSYVDSLNNTISAQTISNGSVAFGPRVSYLIEGELFNITPSIGVIGAWNFSTDGLGRTSSEWAARLEGSIDLRLDGGATLNAKVFYDGIGVSTRQAYGASAGLRVPLN